jgi:hypothetical protein
MERELCVQKIINLEKSRDGCWSRYLISKNKTFTLLCLLNLFIKIIFLFKQTIIYRNRDTN